MTIRTTVIGIRDHSLLQGLAFGDDHSQYQKESEKGFASGYASLDAGADVPVGQLDNVGSPSVASDDLQVSADTERSHQGESPVKQKEITIGFGGTLRIKFDLKSSFAGCLAYGQIYKNGVAVGTERSNNTTTYQPFSEDIPGLSAGDKVQLYSWIQSASYAVLIQNFRLYFDFETVDLD